MTRPQAVASTGRDVDLRGFAYPLEPMRQKLQWRLERLSAELTQAQQMLAETEQRIAGLQALHDREAIAAAVQLQQRPDPLAHRQLLGYLAHLRGQVGRLDKERETQCSERDRLRQACLAQQLRIEGLDRHKADALVSYADEVRRRGVTEQDRDWLARSIVRRSTEVNRP